MKDVITMREVTLGDLTFTCRTCGLDNTGDLVVLLHGFPEGSYLWHEILPILAEKGYRCVAPDQRGYSAKARPKDVDAYAVRHLAGDVIGIAETFTKDKFHLVGHDWGSTVGWAVLALYGDRLLSSTNLCTYYPAEYAQVLQTNPEQRERSQYAFGFLEPDAADKLLANGCEGIRTSYWAELPQDSIDEYLKIFGTREGLEAALSWYRAKYGWMKEPDGVERNKIEYGDIYVPVQCVRGLHDPYKVADGYNRMHKYFKGPYTFIQYEAGHWMMENNADFCIPLICAHIERYSSKR